MEVSSAPQAVLDATVPAIEVSGLTKVYGDHSALRGVDLRVGRGESVVIFGPNGAGKTTLIKSLATIVRPTAGRIKVDGLDLREKAEEVRRRIGIVGHFTYLYGNLTAYENLDFYGRVYDIPQRARRVREVTALVGMSDRLNDRLASLSRGMQQRLSIARALLHDPPIMLLDEPETGLDRQSASAIWSAVRGEAGRRRTLVMTTHDLERGFALCERIVILNRGRVAYEGASCDLDIARLKDVYESVTAVRV